MGVRINGLEHYASWHLSANKINGDEVRDGLVKTVEEAGLGKSIMNRTRFKKDGLVVDFGYEKISVINVEINLYASDVKKAEELRQTIMKQIDSYKERNMLLTSRESLDSAFQK